MRLATTTFFSLALGALGCAELTLRRTVTLDELAAAPRAPERSLARHVVSDPTGLAPLVRPIGRRVGLVEIRTQAQWRRLARTTPGMGVCPDLDRGIVVGLLSRTGTPIDGKWPVSWDAVRLSPGGAGLVEARFTPGNYLPDGRTYLETRYVEGLDTVLLVDLDGIHYFPNAR